MSKRLSFSGILSNQYALCDCIITSPDLKYCYGSVLMRGAGDAAYSTNLGACDKRLSTIP